MKSYSFIKTGLDQFITQISWSSWALFFLLLTNLIPKLFFASNKDSFYASGYIASNIYMFVIGIISISLLSYYVENGVTRKNYYWGNVIASAGLSIIIPIIIYIISLIENFLTTAAITMEGLERVEIDTDGHIIGEIIQLMIIPPFINPDKALLSSLALFSINLFMFYTTGWLIAAAFKRLWVIGGILFVGIGIGFIAIKDSLLRLVIDHPLYVNFSFVEVIPKSFVLPLIVIIILLTCSIIRLLTSKVTIDI